MNLTQFTGEILNLIHTNSMNEAREKLNALPNLSQWNRLSLEFGDQKLMMFATLAEMVDLSNIAQFVLRRCIEINPRNYFARFNLAINLAQTGEKDRAVNELKEVIKLNPYIAKTYMLLSEMITLDKNSSESDLFENAEKNLGLFPKSEFYSILFALGKYYKDIKDYDRSFSYYRLGADILRTLGKRGAATSVIDACNRQIAQFQRIPELKVVSEIDIKPIFIVGMPRSGSTLVEQILSTHSLVNAIGETTLFEDSVVKQISIDQLKNGKLPQNQGQIKSAVDQYLSRLMTSRTGNTVYITDKMLGNYIYLGYLLTLFPDAPVINCRRHPLDTLISCYTTPFSEGYQFATDLDELADVYISYDKTMNHFNSLSRRKILTVDYEDVVTDFDHQVKRILAFCDLPFEEGCIRFYQASNQVKTASYHQIRQPIYKSSMSRWKVYEKYLGSVRLKLLPLINERGLNKS